MRLLSLILLIFCVACSATSSLLEETDKIELAQPKIIDGKCYQKVLIDPETYDLLDSYPVFTGKDTSNYYFGIIETLVSPAISKWVKTKVNRNCLSVNPEDCFVWCLVKSPAQIEEILNKQQTSYIKNLL